MSTLNQDRTSNRLALCSAIFAGFAYVGYTTVRQAFGWRKPNNGFFRDENDCLGLEYEPEPGGKVYLRRLSGSSCSGGVGRSGDTEAATLQSVLRPLSVRERLRELNLNAMAFTDTLLILHGKKPLGVGGPRSLQSSPFHSPTRILSPLDVSRHFLLAEDPEADSDSRPGTPRLSRRSSRRNLSRRSLANSVVNLSSEEQGEASAQAQSLLQEREAELTRRLQSLQSNRPRELTPYESRSLVALLHSEDEEKIARTLVTISNLAAFTRNQEGLREAGMLVVLPSLLASHSPASQLAAIRAAANLALNTGNLKEMEQTVLVLVLLADHNNNNRYEKDPELLSQVFLSLTNLAVLPDWHHHFHPLLPSLLHLISLKTNSERAKEAVKFQCLRLLINLACNDENIPQLLASPCPADIVNLVSRSKPEDQLLRCVTLLANIYMAAQRKGLHLQEHKAHSLQRVMFGEDSQHILREVRWITDNSTNMDIKSQARKILTCLEGIP